MLGAGDEGTVVLDKTPFYAVSGGQVGDSGVISCGDNVFIVADTSKMQMVFIFMRAAFQRE